MKTPRHRRIPREQSDYLHGFSLTEQRRLVRQAKYWRHTLIPIGLDYRPGERVLEIGCAAGATLGEIGRAFPGIQMSGLDLEPRQIEFAGVHLRSLGISADLRVGNAAQLPWKSGYFDHVYVMWLLEHLNDSRAALREAHRVLRPGGTITITETDYTSFKVTPSSPDWDYLERAQYEHFARYGNPVAGRQLGILLSKAGFKNVRNGPVGFHFFRGAEGFRQHVDYILEFLEPGLDKMASLGFAKERLQKGAKYLQSLPQRTEGSITTIVYRAHGTKPKRSRLPTTERNSRQRRA